MWGEAIQNLYRTPSTAPGMLKTDILLCVFVHDFAHFHIWSSLKFVASAHVERFFTAFSSEYLLFVLVDNSLVAHAFECMSAVSPPFSVERLQFPLRAELSPFLHFHHLISLSLLHTHRFLRSQIRGESVLFGKLFFSCFSRQQSPRRPIPKAISVTRSLLLCRS